VSIVAYTGLPGSGKSYSVVEHQIIPALTKGRTVVTNLPMREEALTALGLMGRLVVFPLDVVKAEPDRIREYVTPGCVFVLDEAWRLFPQGEQANRVPDAFKSLLAEHRHMVDDAGNSTQLVFVVQDLANIGAFARRLVENTFVTTKLGFVGLNGSFRVDVFHGAQTGATPPVSNRLRMLTGRYNKKIFALYKSHTMSDAEEGVAGNEAKVDGRANILKRPVMIIGAILCPLLIWYSLHSFGKAFSRFAPDGKPQPAQLLGPANARSGAERAAGPPGRTGQGVESHPIRLLMYVGDAVSPGRGVGYLTDGARVHRLSADQCQVVAGESVRCLFEGSYYDGSGFAGPGASAPRKTEARSADQVTAPGAVEAERPSA
jgi:zona occludens toxin (predicted ATPase)